MTKFPEKRTEERPDFSTESATLLMEEGGGGRAWVYIDHKLGGVRW
jgi:hypothetical protein